MSTLKPQIDLIPDPNDEVERWKDRLYEEIKDLPKDQIGEYLDRKADRALRRVGAAQKPVQTR